MKFYCLCVYECSHCINAYGLRGSGSGKLNSMQFFMHLQWRFIQSALQTIFFLSLCNFWFQFLFNLIHFMVKTKDFLIIRRFISVPKWKWMIIVAWILLGGGFGLKEMNENRKIGKCSPATDTTLFLISNESVVFRKLEPNMPMMATFHRLC